jgi:hypothetical protein
MQCELFWSGPFFAKHDRCSVGSLCLANGYYSISLFILYSLEPIMDKRKHLKGRAAGCGFFAHMLFPMLTAEVLLYFCTEYHNSIQNITI